MLTFAAVWGAVRDLGRIPVHARGRVRAARAARAAHRWWWLFPPSPCSRGRRARSRCCCSPSVLVGAPRWRAAVFALALVAAADRARAPLPRPRPLPVSVERATRGDRVRRRRRHRSRASATARHLRRVPRFRRCSRSRSSRSSARTRRACASWRYRSPCSPCATTALGRRPARRAVRRVQPDAAHLELRQGKDERAEDRSYWAPALDFLRAHRDPNFRVNALDTVEHWEACTCREAGFPITRGWYRQDDFPENEILYSDDLNRRRYVRWLHERGVRYVLVPGGRLDYSSEREPRSRARCRSSRGAATSRSTRRRSPQPIAPGADVVRITHERATLRVPQRRPLRGEDPRARDVRRAARRHIHARLLLDRTGRRRRRSAARRRAPAHVLDVALLPFVGSERDATETRRSGLPRRLR